ncbi:MAG: aminoglycoside phosphotransferase family protein [Hyphomicrobiaceae bacterium]
MPNAPFADHIARWGLVPDGEPIVTHGSRLLPVRRQGVPAMLKVAVEPEEKFGGDLLTWWDGDGAARVLAREGDAVLIERAVSGRTLADLVDEGRDDEATRIACAVVAKLHRPRAAPAPQLVPLTTWFKALAPAAEAHGGILRRSAATADALLAAPQDARPLHGDIHHGNILDFGTRGWLAIDPMRLVGERGFDYANLFCNPDHETATSPERFQRRLAIVAEAAQIERERLLQWIVAWAGLGAAWFIEDEGEADTDLRVAEMAAAELDR